MKEKLAMVCQRYGLEVNGGSELYCRQLAEQLSAHYDVVVYTTCAMDYVTWKNQYAEGVEEINGVTVRRFRVEKERKQGPFAEISARVLGRADHTDAEETRWLEEQGPVCPKLLDALYAEQSQYRSVIFMTYLYYLTAMGLPRGFQNAYLIPTTHDEPPVYLRWYDKVYAGAKGFIWLTPEEREFAVKRFPFVGDMPGVIAGSGVEFPAGELPELPPALRDVPYIVYAGRIDESKGCGEMFDFFRRYKKERGGELKLALMGKPVMEVPQAEDIVSLGFVSDEMKFAVMAQAQALVLFSQFESLSMVVLESMAVSRPVLVNGKCLVLKGHCVRSNAGLWFESYPEFAAALDWLLTHPAERQVMGKNGVAYVKENYQWDKIVARIQGLIEGKPASGAAGAEKKAH